MVVAARENPTTKNKHKRSILAVVGGGRWVVVVVCALVSGGGEVGGGKRKPTATENEHVRSILRVTVAAAAREIPTTTENESERSFSGVVGLLVEARGNPQSPKTSVRARFWGLWGSWWRQRPEKAHNQ